MIISKELNDYSDLVKRMGTDKRVLATHVSLSRLYLFFGSGMALSVLLPLPERQ
jgi:hypothetical protein